MISKSLSRSRMAPLAVLPFEDLEASADHDYLAAGFTEGATTALGHIDPARLSMIGRTSVMTYKDTTKTLAQIGRISSRDPFVPREDAGASRRG